MTEHSDFAVIDPARGIRVATSVPHWGRVRGTDDSPKAGDVIRLYGQGLAFSALAPARQGVVTSADSRVVRAAIASDPGDSGGPVLSSSNEAEGLLVAFQPNPPPTTGAINIMRIAPMLRRASAAMEVRLALA
jgi:hypothetical protein